MKTHFARWATVATLAIAIGGTGTVASAGQSQEARSTAGAEARAKADALVARMTLDEKIALLHGLFPPMAAGKTTNELIPSAGHIDGIPRLGIPWSAKATPRLASPIRSSSARATWRLPCPPVSPRRRASIPPSRGRAAR